MTVHMVKDKETKGAIRYAEIDAKGKVIDDFTKVKIGSLYIRRSAFKELPPQNITVEVTF